MSRGFHSVRCVLRLAAELPSQVFETVPFIPDSSVEKIGGAFVEEERSLRQVLKRSSGE